MARFYCLLVIALLATISVRGQSPASSEASTEIRPAKVEITGAGFEIQELRTNSLAFSNRDYVWMNIPADLEGLRYTQTGGGSAATMHLKASESGRIFAAVAASRILDLKKEGWTLSMPDRSNTFFYNDVNRLMMVILSRNITEGDEFDIPQLGWAGTIILLPSEPSENAKAK